LNILDARVHCAVLKLRTNPPHRPAYPHPSTRKERKRFATRGDPY
jgi:hypothetical protein